ncbi:MAG: SpoIIE family protein phosphatase [Pseudomonadota bacterium]
MPLRIRIPLILLSFLALLSALGWGAATLREQELESRFAASTANDREILWREIVETFVAAMEDKVWVVREDRQIRGALQDADAVRIQETSRRSHAAVVTANIAARLDILDDAARLVFSSARPSSPSALLAPDVARSVVVDGERRRGVGNDKNGSVAVAIAYPILSDDGRRLGVGVYGRDVAEALAEFAESVGGDAYLVNRRGRLLAGTDEALWARLGETGVAGMGSAPTRAGVDGREYDVAGFPFIAEIGTLRGRIVTAIDVTEDAAAARELETLSVIAFLATALSLVGVVTILLRRTFGRLTRAVDALRELSQPDAVVAARVDRQRTIDLVFDGRAGSDKDEVGQIDDAVSVFRANQDAIGRLRAARARAREKQDALIREEMTRLAGTLDDKAREDLLADLEEVERIAAAQGSDDDLGATALAFAKLSERIRGQQATLNRLIDELRVALETQTEFMALQRELAIGQRVQTSILPPPMSPHKGVDVRGAMRPAKEIGGDFYDHFVMDDGSVGVVVADVSGKGVPAALFMAISQSLLRATVVQKRNPAEALSTLNDLLVESNREELFVTLFYGVIDPETGVMTYANAGHNPPILLRDGKAEFVPGTGDLALAIIDDVDYECASLEFMAGDRLFVYTDGVTEALNVDDEEYGDERTLALIARLADTPDDAFVDAVVADVDAFVGAAPQADDITALFVSFRGEARGEAN